MKLLVFLALIGAAYGLEVSDLMDQSEARTVYSANGGLYLGLNSSVLVLSLVGLAVAAAVLYAVFLFVQVPPAYEKQGYYEPDLAAANNPAASQALAYAVQAQESQYRQRRSPDFNLATKMIQLENAFKKFRVEEEECKMFVACEAAQLSKVQKSRTPIIPIISRIFMANQEDNKLDAAMTRVNDAFNLGLEAHVNGQENACFELRKACTNAYNRQ